MMMLAFPVYRPGDMFKFIRASLLVVRASLLVVAVSGQHRWDMQAPGEGVIQDDKRNHLPQQRPPPPPPPHVGFGNPRWEVEQHARQDHHLKQKRAWEEQDRQQDPQVPPQVNSPPVPGLGESGPAENQGSIFEVPPSPPQATDGPMDAARTEDKEYAPLSLPPADYQNLHLSYNAEEPAHIFLATPCYGGMVGEGFAMSLIELSLRMNAVPGVALSLKLLPGDSLVTRARNTLVALFLGVKEYTHLLFIDSDITFTTDNVLRLLHMSKRKPIVAAPYPKKGFMFDALRRHVQSTVASDPSHQFTEAELQDSMIDFVFNSFSENDGSPVGRALQMEDGFVRVDNAGTGFLMIRRDVLETMAEFYSDLNYSNDIPAYSSPATDSNFYGLFDTMIDPSSRRLLSEDYAFCRRAHALGYETWMDLTADLKHSGTYTFDGNFAKSFVMEVPR